MSQIFPAVGKNLLGRMSNCPTYSPPGSGGAQGWSSNRSVGARISSGSRTGCPNSLTIQALSAALPPAVRKASGFPAKAASFLPLRAGWKAKPSSLRGGSCSGHTRHGKAKPFRTAGGRAACSGQLFLSPLPGLVSFSATSSHGFRQGPHSAAATRLGCWCHFRDTGAPRCSHSRESGNLLRQPLEMRCRRTGFPLSRE
jgi:hypothetical protein